MAKCLGKCGRWTPGTVCTQCRNSLSVSARRRLDDSRGTADIIALFASQPSTHTTGSCDSSDSGSSGGGCE